MAHLGEDTGMWDEEDGFFYDVLRCPTARPSGSRSGRWSACCRCARPRSSRESCWRSIPNSASGSSGSSTSRPELRAAIHDPTQARRRRPPARLDPGRDQAPPRAGEDARRERVPQPVRHPLAVALPRRSSLCHPGRRPGIPRRLSAGGVRHRHVRRQLELARPDLDAGQRPDHPGPAAVLHSTTATTSPSNVPPAPAGR